MTTKIVTDEQYGQIARRAHELVMRVAKGAIDFELTMKGLQFLIEGQEVRPIGVQDEDWLSEIINRERQCHLNFFGQEFNLSEFERTLKRYSRQKIKRWQKLGLEPHFLPRITMSQEDKYPGWKIKPEEWYYQKLDEGKIFRNVNGRLEVETNSPSILEDITVLIDVRLKPAYYKDGKQMYKDDNLLGSIIQKLRKDGKIAKYEYGPQSSRFSVSADEWESYIKPVLAEKLDLDESQLRLERAIEANVIPQLYPDIPRKNDGNTNTWVWYEEYFEDRGCRLYSGHSDYGGLAVVDAYWSDRHWNSRSVRPLAVL